MARYTEAKCRLCRREGQKLFLKGDRCFTDKCAYERRPYAPGFAGKLRKKLTDYVERAEAQKGVTGANLLILLERRLDNVVYRLGFANSRDQARQMVRHGLFVLNGRKVNIPSLMVRPNDIIEVREKSRKVPVITEAQQVVARRGCPSWLESDGASFKGVVKALPTREDIQFPINEQLIVELYSK